jgi:hypothetical protein
MAAASCATFSGDANTCKLDESIKFKVFHNASTPHLNLTNQHINTHTNKERGMFGAKTKKTGVNAHVYSDLHTYTPALEPWTWSPALNEEN